jgi:hypothetical protein
MASSSPSACTRPPPGWYCSRDKGHEGPCAAVEGLCSAVEGGVPRPIFDLVMFAKWLAAREIKIKEVTDAELTITALQYWDLMHGDGKGE